MPDPSQFNTDRTHPGRWTITFNSPPINMFVPDTLVELGALLTDIQADPSLKVVVFESANPDFFIAHLDVSKAAERPEVLGLWRDFVLRLSSAPVVSLAKIRGRTRGIGNEFMLACDMRFASRQSALFGNPEIGVGLVPGGGALEWLPRVVGRSRALEIVLSSDDFDADIAERYGWVNRTLDDDDLDPFVDTLVRRLASFDREALAAAKAQVNRFGTPTATELQSSNGNVLLDPGLARCPGAPGQGPNYRLRPSKRLRIELRPVPPCAGTGGRRGHGYAARPIVALNRRRRIHARSGGGPSAHDRRRAIVVGDDRSGKTLEYAPDEKRFVRARMKLPNEVTKYGTFARAGNASTASSRRMSSDVRSSRVAMSVLVGRGGGARVPGAHVPRVSGGRVSGQGDQGCRHEGGTGHMASGDPASDGEKNTCALGHTASTLFAAAS